MATVKYLQCYHRGYGSDHSVLENSQLAPEQQNPDTRDQQVNTSSLHQTSIITDLTPPAPSLLSHGPGRAAAEGRQVRLLLLHLQHQDQTGILVAQEVEQEDQEVVDDVGLVALPAGVHVDGQAGIPQSQPLGGGHRFTCFNLDIKYDKT